MKNRMSALDKTLVALYAIVGAVLTLLFAVALYAGAEISAFGYAFKLANGFWPRVAVAVAALIMLFWSYRLLALALSKRGAIDRTSVSISNTENGDVRISMQAMDSLVKRAIGDMSGIASIKTNVLSNDDSISVEVSMALESDVHIPNATMLLQRTVKNFIEEYSGIAVRDVTVIVTSVADPIVVPKPLAIETLPRNPADGALSGVKDEQTRSPQPADGLSDGDKPSFASQPEPEPEPEPTPVAAKQAQTETEPQKEPETEAFLEPEAPIEYTEEIKADKDEEPANAKPEPEPESDFLLSDGLPDIDSFLDQSENVDYNFSQSPQTDVGEAGYYSPYGEPDGDKDNAKN